MTQLKMQQQQYHINMLNQPQKIFTSTQDHWKDNTIINNFHVYTKVQLKTETCQKDTKRETDSLPLNNSRGEHNYSLWQAHIWTTCRWRAKTGSSRETNIFHPKSPNFNFPMPNFDSTSCLIVSKHEKVLELI